MKKIVLLALCTLLIGPCLSCAQQKGGESQGGNDTAAEEREEAKTDSLSILVAGDLMQHSPQINAARSGNGYDYKECFRLVKPEISAADLAIANFEVTLGGPPYKG